MPIYCYDLDGFLKSIDGLEADKPERSVVLGRLDGRHANVLQKEDQNFKRLSDFIFPGEIFADPDTLDDLRNARTDLIVTGVMPSKMLATDHEDVLTYDEYRDVVRDVASDFDDPVFLTGHFHAGRSYRMTGNAKNNKPRHFASMYFPEAVFATDGCAPLKNMASGYPGTVVLEADQLTENAQAVARGEIDSFDLDGREDDSMEPAEIYETLTSLSPGARVRLNDRNRAMEVVPRSETSRLGYANAECMFLTGNGTEYRLTLKEDSYGQLDWSSDTEYVRSVEVVEQADEGQQKVAA
jgi:hypothetical protein